MDAGRFACASSALSLRELLTRGRNALLLGFAFAMAAHSSLTWIRAVGEQDRPAKPLTTQFVKRQPRLTKPLELKRLPKQRKRALRREMVTVRAAMSRAGATTRTQADGVVGNLAKPGIQIARQARFVAAGTEPNAVASVAQVTREPESRMDMSLELLDVQALDTGRYHAMVVQDPSDKREIRGFFRMASVWAQDMTGTENWGPPTQSVIAICKAVQKYTNIQATMAYQFGFDSKELFKTPLVFTRTSNSGFELTASETANLGRYLKAGGLLFGDEGLHKLGGAGDRAFRLVIRQAMESQGFEHGLDWGFERLPDDHAVYHCYFDFEGGPPMGEDRRNKGPARYGTTSYPYLEAMRIGHQVVVLYSMKGLLGASAAWGKWEGYTHLDPARVHQFFVNVVIFALTQEGSITRRVMDEVR